MSSNIQLLNTKKDELVAMQETMLHSAIEAKLQLTPAQDEQFENATKELAAIDKTLLRLAAIDKAKSEVQKPTSDKFVAKTQEGTIGDPFGKTRTFSAEYFNTFWSSFKPSDRSIRMDVAGLNEGVPASGGYAVPVVVADQIIALAPYECAVRKAALNLVTTSDIKFPVELTRGAAAQKSESGVADHSFNVNNPTLTSVTLSAFNNGQDVPVSMELAADVSALSAFVSNQLQRNIAAWEEVKFAAGVGGTIEPQGVINAAAVSISQSLTTYGIDAILDLTAELSPYYYAGASFIMSRQTGVNLWKAQLALSQFQNFFTRVGTQDYLLGWPVNYSYQFPTYSGSPATTGVVMFGDWKAGVYVADRHTSAIITRTLDGTLDYLKGILHITGMRRSDCRVILPSALVQLNVTG